MSFGLDRPQPTAAMASGNYVGEYLNSSLGGANTQPPPSEGPSSIIPRIVQRSNDLYLISRQIRETIYPTQAEVAGKSPEQTPSGLVGVLRMIERQLDEAFIQLDVLRDHLNS